MKKDKEKLIEQYKNDKYIAEIFNEIKRIYELSTPKIVIEIPPLCNFEQGVIKIRYEYNEETLNLVRDWGKVLRLYITGNYSKLITKT